ncbi:MAG: DUF4386 domain-containing protein [Gammaproteobacteria bacterium]
MTNGFTARTLALVAGGSYCIIFIAASFANFYMLESLMADPLTTVRQDAIWIRAGILAFMITVVFDVVVAWALYELFKGHPLTLLSTLFRMMHAAMMGVAIHALPVVLTLASADDILQQIDIFNSIWLLGLFFFGIHIVLLGCIFSRVGFVRLFLLVAGVMYMADTVAYFVLPNYEEYASIFLLFVAVPAIVGEMSFAIWLLVKGGTALLTHVHGDDECPDNVDACG